MWTTTNFDAALITSIINLMNENNCSEIPFSFLANRDNYAGCKAAKIFYDHGYRSLTIKNGELILNGTWEDLGVDFHWIVTEKYYGYEPRTIHHRPATADVLAMVQIAYDTIGSIYFPLPGRDVEEAFAERKEIEELEKSYEARRNEI